MPNRNLSLDRMLVVSWGYPHRASCLCTVLYHSSTLKPSWLNDLRRLVICRTLPNLITMFLLRFNWVLSTKLGTFLNLGHLTIWEEPYIFLYLASLQILLLNIISHLCFQVLNLAYKECINCPIHGWTYINWKVHCDILAKASLLL